MYTGGRHRSAGRPAPDAGREASGARMNAAEGHADPALQFAHHERVDRTTLTDAVRRRARALGFHAAGFAPAGHADPAARLRAWLDKGYAGSMDYMARTVAEREDPRRIVPGARSVVALAMSYYHPEARPTEPLKVSRYAVSDDYHTVLRKKARKLRRFILEHRPGAVVKPTVDTSPVLEREWARRAGVAWIGKSTMAIHPRLGTYTFLSTLVTTVDFAYDTPLPDRCGSCTRCLQACPTQAFTGPYVLDATRCITFWNVETREDFGDRAPDLHGWVAGCDICQEVCPWNKFARESEEPRLHPRPALTAPSPRIFADEDAHDALADVLRGTALQRTGARAIRRNARRILGRTPEPAESRRDP